MSSLKVAVIYDPPKSTLCALDDTCPLPGYGIEFTRFVCQSLQLNCTFQWYNSSEYGDAAEMGVGTGLVGAIQRGEFDTSIPVFSLSYKRSTAIDFSDTYDMSDTILFTRAPSIKNELNWNIIFAFQFRVWIAYFLSLLMTSFVISLISNFPSSLSLKILIPLFFEACRVSILIEFNRKDLRKTSTRVVVFSWIISVLTLTSAYTGMLYSQTIFVKYDLPYTDLETFVQCLEKQECRLITNTTSGGNLQQLASNDRIGNRVKKSLEKNFWKLAPVDDIPKIMLEEKNQYLVNIGPRGNRLSWIEGNRNCLYYTMGLSYFQTKAFPLAKNASAELKRKFNEILSSSREFGLIQALDKKYKSDSSCKEDWGTSRPSNLKLADGRMLFSMATSFYFYVLSLFISFTTLATEFVAKYFLLSREHELSYALGRAH